VFLDACRDNPFAAKIRSAGPPAASMSRQDLPNEIRRRHADRIRDRPGQPRSMARRAPTARSTRALIANIAQPGVENPAGDDQGPRPGQRETSKNQLPWGHTNLIGSV